MKRDYLGDNKNAFDLPSFDTREPIQKLLACRSIA